MLDNEDTIQNLIDTVNDLSNRIGAIESSTITVNTGNLEDDTVTTPKLANDAVTTLKLANEAVTADKIANGSITSNKLETNLYNELTRQATITERGIVELADDSEAESLTNTSNAMTPNAVKIALSKLGLMGNLSSNVLYESNLNNISTTCNKFYDITSTNKPPFEGFNYGFVFTYNENQYVRVQIATSVFNGNIATRRFRDPTYDNSSLGWTGWKRVLLQDDFGIGSDLANNPNTNLHATSTNLDSVILPGEYYYGANCLNRPSEYGLLKVWRENNNLIYQQAQSSDSYGKSFFMTRYRRVNNTWTDWYYAENYTCENRTATLQSGIYVYKLNNSDFYSNKYLVINSDTSSNTSYINIDASLLNNVQIGKSVTIVRDNNFNGNWIVNVSNGAGIYPVASGKTFILRESGSAISITYRGSNSYSVVGEQA